MIACLAATACAASAADPRPNLVVIMADDLGYETIGANGGQSYATPRLDSLAASGMRFRHAHSQPLCTPTRVQLMTGRYNVRNYDVFGVLHPGQTTFANVLRDAGYKTFIAGKWQLEGGYKGPVRFGFDEYFLWQLNRRPNRYYAPGFEARIPADGLANTQVNFPAGTYGPEVVCAKIIDFIERNQAGPFLVYYPMLLTHDPFTPPPDHPDYNPAATKELNNTAYFRSMVEFMDKLVGRIVDKLDALGIRDNTLILFLGDNGTHSSITSMFDGKSVQGGKGKTTMAGTHTPFIVNWPKAVAAGRVCDDLIDTTDVFTTLCEAAGAVAPGDLDGRSFLPQLVGDSGTPREWSYCWYKPQNATEAGVREFAQTRRFKLYATGNFHDLASDVLEQRPLNTGALDTEARAAFDLLTGALASFGDARADRALAPRQDPAVWASPPAAAGIGSIGMTAAPATDGNGPVEYQFRNVTLSRDSAWQTTPRHIDSGLVGETSHTYQVRMRDLLGNTTDWSGTRSATTLASPNTPVVIVEQPDTDGDSGSQNLGQSFTVPAQDGGWFLEAFTFYAAAATSGGSSAHLTLYDGFTNRTNRGRILAVSTNAVSNPRVQGLAMSWNFSDVWMEPGNTCFAAFSDAAGSPLAANQGIPAQRWLANAYDGGSRLNESGITPDVDLRFTITARRFPASYAQWLLTIPDGLPRSFGETIRPGEMPNGWRYFFGLRPYEHDPSRWPRITGSDYTFAADPKVTDVFWRIRHTSDLRVPLASWRTIDADSPEVLHDPVSGRIRLPLTGPAGFFRLEIGLRDGSETQ